MNEKDRGHDDDDDNPAVLLLHGPKPVSLAGVKSAIQTAWNQQGSHREKEKSKQMELVILSTDLTQDPFVVDELCNNLLKWSGSAMQALNLENTMVLERDIARLVEAMPTLKKLSFPSRTPKGTEQVLEFAAATRLTRLSIQFGSSWSSESLERLFSEDFLAPFNNLQQLHVSLTGPSLQSLIALCRAVAQSQSLCLEWTLTVLNRGRPPIVAGRRSGLRWINALHQCCPPPKRLLLENCGLVQARVELDLYEKVAPKMSTHNNSGSFLSIKEDGILQGAALQHLTDAVPQMQVQHLLVLDTARHLDVDGRTAAQQTRMLAALHRNASLTNVLMASGSASLLSSSTVRHILHRNRLWARVRHLAQGDDSRLPLWPHVLAALLARQQANDSGLTATPAYWLIQDQCAPLLNSRLTPATMSQRHEEAPI